MTEEHKVLHLSAVWHFACLLDVEVNVFWNNELCYSHCYRQYKYGILIILSCVVFLFVFFFTSIFFSCIWISVSLWFQSCLTVVFKTAEVVELLSVKDSSGWVTAVLAQFFLWDSFSVGSGGSCYSRCYKTTQIES